MFVVWPTNMDHGGDYGADNNKTVKYTVKFQYDYYLSIGIT